MDGEAETKGVNQVKPRTIILHTLSEILAMEISLVIPNTIMLWLVLNKLMHQLILNLLFHCLTMKVMIVLVLASLKGRKSLVFTRLYV